MALSASTCLPLTRISTRTGSCSVRCAATGTVNRPTASVAKGSHQPRDARHGTFWVRIIVNLFSKAARAAGLAARTAGAGTAKSGLLTAFTSTVA